ncbi:hypothetical protein M0805_008904 [Coniferiporia weirii]|nr:hypothetical protein M0805_008904 [Coniferiporia weirii]
MTIAVTIHTPSSSLFMSNDPETSSAYSLSGHVSVSLTSSGHVFEKAHPIKVLLRSLKLTFEGQSELIMHEMGYSATRLCTVSRELAPAQAMMLTNDGQEDSNSPCVWNFVFDLPVPGWLPSSSAFGNNSHGLAGTRYALFAEARFTFLEEGPARAWSLSSLCAPFIPKQKTVKAAPVVIELVRYMLPPAVCDSEPSVRFSEASYMIETRYDRNPKSGSSSRISLDVLSEIEVLASVPECVDLDDDSVNLTIRLRARKLSPDVRRRLRLTEFQALVTQHEVYRRNPSRSYTSTFPLPPSQPENRPLLDPHPIKALYDLGIVAESDAIADASSKLRTAFPLLSKRQMGRKKLPGGGVLFAQEAYRADEHAWCRVEVNVPFEHFLPGGDVEWEDRHGRIKVLRVSEESPLFRVYHELDVELTCTCDAEEEGDSPQMERLVFSIPVKFARFPPVLSARVSTPLPTSLRTSPRSPSEPERSVHVSAVSGMNACQTPFALPPYSQLFYSNGDRRIDDSVPLPVYTPRVMREPATSIAGDKP